MLKKVCVIFSAVILVLGLYLNNKTPVFSGLANTFEVHLTDYSDTRAQLTLKQSEFVFLSGVKGESCVIEIKDFDLQRYLEEMNASVIFTHEFLDSKNYYAYSPKIKYCKMIDGKMINLQVCVKKDGVKLGSPIIYGSF
ncbi:MAG: hypothetical protein E7348_01350 [Clostridiales bacterium]|nr:hypothetical protein [Clostridiales bacterium]